ncbi:MAG: hypothetical protein Q8M16_11670 [Pirellulaceae bacterium]|nr:hypothetical protein [Pirellulaceae bacterium]
MAEYFKVAMDDERRWHLELLAVKPPIDIWACCQVDVSLPVKFGVLVPGLKVDYNPSCFAIPVVSKRFADVLQSISPDEIQRLPASVDNDPNNWKVLNVVSKVDCIDYARSSIQSYPQDHPEKPGKPRGVLRLVIDKNLAKGHHVFRAKDWEVVLIVSNDVKAALARLPVTGLEFIPVSD